MSQFGKPWPEIPRFPREPRLPGVPHQLQESVFSDKSLADAANLVVETRDLSSDARQRFLRDYLRRTSDESLVSAVDGLGNYVDPDLNQSQRLRGQGARLLRTLEKNVRTDETIEKPAWTTNPDINDATAYILETAGIAAFDIIANDVTKFSRLKPAKQQEMLTKQANELFETPLELGMKLVDLDIFTSKNLVKSADNPTFYDKVEDYKSRLTARIASMTGASYHELPDQRTLYYWLCLSAGVLGEEKRPGGQIAQGLARKHLRSFLTREDDPEYVIDTFYEIAKAGIMNGNDDVLKYTIDMMYGRTDIMPVESAQFMDYAFGSVICSGEHRRKAFELIMARRDILAFYPGSIGRAFNLDLLKLRKSEKFKKHAHKRRMQKMFKVGPAQFMEEFSEVKERGFTLSSAIRQGLPKKGAINPYDTGDLGDARGPIMEFIREAKGASWGKKFKPKKQTAALIFPGEAQFVSLPVSEITDYVKDRCARGQGETLAARKFWRAISYLLPPDISRDDLQKVDDLNKQLRQDIKQNQVHTLSPRGDRVEVMDPLLEELGFSHLTYRMSENDKSKIDVKVKIGGFTYEAHLTPGMQLVSKDESSLYLPEAGSFIRHIILAHLHAVVCTDDVGEASDNGEITEARKAFAARRAHRRILPLGFKPQAEQVVKIYEEYGIDLRQRNSERLVAGVQQLITWVSEVDSIALAGTGAVVSKAPKATENLRKALGLPA